MELSTSMVGRKFLYPHSEACNLFLLSCYCLGELPGNFNLDEGWKLRIATFEASVGFRYQEWRSLQPDVTLNQKGLQANKVSTYRHLPLLLFDLPLKCKLVF
jgi:hypothetical protein